MTGNPSLPIAIEVQLPTLLAVSTLVDDAAVQAALLQCVTRRSPLVESQWLMTARPSVPMAIQV